tara:strand:- start:18 stop:455 length:438 start_codon:yes stop_codon:yes gene_type:complete
MKIIKKMKNKHLTYDKISSFSDFHTYINSISSNKFFLGIMMILMNFGSRYIELKLTKGQERIIKNLAREILIFTIAFMGSRDILIALGITAIFIILSNFVLNENSKFNILPKNYLKILNEIDENNDGEISKDEIEKALKKLKNSK